MAREETTQAVITMRDNYQNLHADLEESMQMLSRWGPLLSTLWSTLEAVWPGVLSPAQRLGLQAGCGHWQLPDCSGLDRCSSGSQRAV